MALNALCLQGATAAVGGSDDPSLLDGRETVCTLKTFEEIKNGMTVRVTAAPPQDEQTREP